MKALLFILAISSFSISVRAQEFKLNLEKTTDKYGLNLKKENPAIPSFKSNDLSLKTKRFQLGERPDSIVINRRGYPRLHANMWHVIPDTRNIAGIPNALPYFIIPEIAAIPNPLLRNKNDFFKPSPLN